MKPPVDAPTSTQSRPAGSTPSPSSPCASFSPPRETYGGGARPRARRPRRPAGPGLSYPWTSPARRAPAPARATPRARARRGGRRGASSHPVLGLAAEPGDVRLPAVDHVAESLAARGPSMRLKSSRCAAGSPVSTRSSSGRSSSALQPASGWWRNSHSRYLLYGRTRSSSAKIVRSAVRDSLHRVEPRPVAQRAVRLVDVVVERVSDDRVACCRPAATPCSATTARELAAGLVERRRRRGPRHTANARRGVARSSSSVAATTSHSGAVRVTETRARTAPVRRRCLRARRRRPSPTARRP